VKRWNRRRILTTAGLAAVLIGIALLLSGAARGIALYAYLLLLVLMAVVMVGSRIGRAWPPTPRFERLIPPRVEPEGRVLQLEGLVGRLAGGSPNAFDLHQRVRPLVRQIVAAQLARGRGIDLDSRPDRAEQLVGPWTWQLIRPDAAAPADSWGQTWTRPEMNALVSELEQLR
jgi:hypothetical protein